MRYTPTTLNTAQKLWKKFLRDGASNQHEQRQTPLARPPGWAPRIPCPSGRRTHLPLRYWYFALSRAASACRRSDGRAGALARFDPAISSRTAPPNLHRPSPPHRRVPHPPRFRALALFGRRSHRQVDSPLMPASENLHNCGITQCSEHRHQREPSFPTMIGVR
jgi:hypothetical protein